MQFAKIVCNCVGHGPERAREFPLAVTIVLLLVPVLAVALVLIMCFAYANYRRNHGAIRRQQAGPFLCCKLFCLLFSTLDVSWRINQHAMGMRHAITTQCVQNLLH